MLAHPLTFLVQQFVRLRPKSIIALALYACLTMHAYARFDVKTACADDAIIVEYDVRAGGELVGLPLKIDDKEYRFMIGASCAYWIVDDSLRTSLIPLDSRTAAASDGTKLFLLPPASIGPFIPFAQSKAAVLQLRKQMLAMGADMYGIIGFEFLRDKVFSIDFDRGKIAFLREAGRDRGRRFKLELVDEGDGPLPFLTVELPTGGERFRLGTNSPGFQAGSLAHSTFARLLKGGWLSLVSDVGKIYPVAGQGRTRSGRLASFALGELHHKKLLFDDSLYSSLDLGYLSRYIVTFDFRNGFVYLRPGKDYDRIDREVTAGFSVARARDVIPGAPDALIYDVIQGGPGQAAGLENYDELRSVDGQNASTTSIFQIMRTFSEPGRHDVVYKRGSEQMRTTVVIEDDLRAAAEKEEQDADDSK